MPSCVRGVRGWYLAGGKGFCEQSKQCKQSEPIELIELIETVETVETVEPGNYFFSGFTAFTLNLPEKK